MWEDGHSAIRAQRRSRGAPPAPQLSVRCAGGARRGCRGRTDLWEGTKLGHRMEVPVAMAMRLAVGFLDWGPGVASADQRKRRLGGMVAGRWRSQGPCFSQVLWGLLLKMPSHMLFPVVLQQFRGSPGFPGPNGAPESRGGRGRLVSTRRPARTLLAVRVSEPLPEGGASGPSGPESFHAAGSAFLRTPEGKSLSYGFSLFKQLTDCICLTDTWHIFYPCFSWGPWYSTVLPILCSFEISLPNETASDNIYKSAL